MTASLVTGARAAGADGLDDGASHDAGCLRPFCCNPFAAFSAFPRVGGWTPPLPDERAAEPTAGDA
ncbi:hypothetical protein [Burkholderia cepacia]|uniref:hypothetical protein n=1 Tax=Burkholderia cepacia TaxID=292 RepID=UPI000755FACA|nr:hypothetical protein [Burkholderia cepacia]KVF13102.1 hypothetical protein WJ06_31995 [Burkholderia cepacia]KWC84272.1 hypothetical protein WL58_17360 [Burkholderia cepacia]UIY58652.1 hypothetical protein LZ568_26775 [Burkholderia cepacia]